MINLTRLTNLKINQLSEFQIYNLEKTGIYKSVDITFAADEYYYIRFMRIIQFFLKTNDDLIQCGKKTNRGTRLIATQRNGFFYCITQYCDIIYFNVLNNNTLYTSAALD